MVHITFQQSMHIVPTVDLIHNRLVSFRDCHCVARSTCPLVAPLARPLVSLPSCLLVVFSLHRALVALLRRLDVAPPLVAPPSHPLVAPPHSCPIALLSLHRPLIASSCRLVVVLSLVAPLSCLLVAPLHSRPIVVLSMRHPLVALSRRLSSRCRLVLSLRLRTLVQPLSSHCAALLLPHRFDGTGIGGIRGCVLADHSDHRFLPPPRDVRRAWSQGSRAPAGTDHASGTMSSLGRSLARHSQVGRQPRPALSGSNVHGVVCKQRILVSSIGRLFQLPKILWQDCIVSPPKSTTAPHLSHNKHKHKMEPDPVHPRVYDKANFSGSEFPKGH